MIFQDRQEAGLLLAKELLQWQSADPLVVALPRGGVPVAAEVARQLHAPLDVLIVRKLGAPENPEYAIGALAEGCPPWLRKDAVRAVGVTPERLAVIVKRAEEEIRRRVQLYRQGRAPADVKGRTVLLIDDGLATGATMTAAVHALREKGAGRIIVGVPVAASDSARALRREVDALVAVIDTEDLYAIGQWYREFRQVEDAEVVRLLSAQVEPGAAAVAGGSVQISDHSISLPGDLVLPPGCRAAVIFAHGSGSSRRSVRNVRVARKLNEAGLGTLLFDLLLPEEAEERRNVFSIPLLTGRLAMATHWLQQQTGALPIGYFGASTGAAAALCAAALPQNPAYAVVSRGGRPDLAEASLPKVRAPVLLIVGGADEEVLQLNERAQRRLPHAELAIVPHAGHLFEEPGALDAVVRHAVRWFSEHLPEVTAGRRVQSG